MANRHAGAPDLTARHGRIGVVAVLSRQIECDREALLSGFQILMEALIGLARIAKTGVGPYNPGFAPDRGLFGFRFRLGHSALSLAIE